MKVDPRIDRLQRRSVTNPGVLSLAGGLPSEETFPLEGLAQALRNAGARALQYDWPEGQAELRTQIAARLARRGAAVDPGDIIVTNGAQQAIDIATRVVTEEGDTVSVPAECYPAALELFRARGLCLTTGSHADAKLAYAMPAIANPTGAVLSRPERDALLRDSRFVLEDDAYAELAFDGRCDSPLFPFASDHVAHVGTFSKTLCPGLRVGWLVVPSAYREAARRAKQLADLQSNGLAQCMVERFLALEDFDRHLERLREYYSRRAAALAEAVHRELPSFPFREPRGGFSLWVTTELEGDDAELLATALTHGVSFDPGGDFRPDGAASPLAMRLAFSSLPIPSMRDAARRLARAVAAYANRHAACTTLPHVHPPNLTQEGTERRQPTASSNGDQQAEKTHPVEERSGRASPAATRE
jgi:2-aminoadipate transaminase